MEDGSSPESKAPDPRFWTAVEEAFSAVLEAGESARTAALDAHCQKSGPLRVEVEALLAAHAQAGDFISPMATKPGEPWDTATEDADSDVERRIGAFVLKERVAEGGMGAVYRAERVGGEFSQQVAVKLIASRLYGADTLRRFRAERQILASLQHPNIVVLLDGGVTSDGHPYIAMEYIDGLPITEYCRRHALSLPARIRLFQSLCSAVSFAHRHLVVHRDLKPANVLVTAEGVVKVLDFGVAKLLDSEGQPAEATNALLGPLTPDYASPEQLKGAPVTTASDVYALGVVLFELLSGSRPYRTAGKTVDELMTIVLHQEPPRPSAVPRAELPYDPRLLRGDLDAIVLTAMAKEPDRRYASAGELADELRRHLEGRPVATREPSLRYLAEKTFARHKAAFSVASVLLVLLLVALSGAVWQARVAARERERALRRFDDVRQLTSSMIFKIHDAIAPLAGSTPARRTVIAEGLKFLEVLQRDAEGDPALQLELARGHLRIWGVLAGPNSNLGDGEGGLVSLRKAVALLRPLAASAKVGDDVLAAWIEANLGLSYVPAGEERDAALKIALEVAQNWLSRAPNDVQAQHMLARVLFRKAFLTKYPGSLPHWQEANRLFRAVLASAPTDSAKRRNVALVEKYLGGYYQLAEDYPAAAAHFQQAYELDLARVRAAPNDASAQLDLAIDLGNVADALWVNGEKERAIAGYLESLEIRRRLSEAGPTDVFARARLAYMHGTLAEAYRSVGRTGDARQHVLRSIAIYETLADNRISQAEACMLLGKIEATAGRPAAACAAYADAQRQFAKRASTEKLFAKPKEESAWIDKQVSACRAR